MCVIFNCEHEFPKFEHLVSAEQMNPHGAGIAWVDNKIVKFKKGIDAKTINKMIKNGKVKLPCIIHFRIGTCGGLGKGLTHPFQICKDTNLALSGEGKDVLFHNGIYSNWQDKFMKLMIKKGITIPKGKWSDSRFLAFMASYHGKDILDLFEGQKISILTPNGIEKYADTDWCDVDKIECSNNYFKNTCYTYSNDFNFDKNEKKRLDEYGKRIDKISKQLLTQQGKLRKTKNKRKKSKIKNNIIKLETKAVLLTEEREDFIQSSNTMNYDDIDGYTEDYNSMPVRSGAMYNDMGWYK